LFGAASALREALHYSLHPVERSEQDRRMGAARAALGEAAFASVWIEGRKMTSEHAVILAVKNEDAVDRGCHPNSQPNQDK
jgi:hypothetical protein